MALDEVEFYFNKDSPALQFNILNLLQSLFNQIYSTLSDQRILVDD